MYTNTRTMNVNASDFPAACRPHPAEASSPPPADPPPPSSSHLPAPPRAPCPAELEPKLVRPPTQPNPILPRSRSCVQPTPLRSTTGAPAWCAHHLAAALASRHRPRSPCPEQQWTAIGINHSIAPSLYLCAPPRASRAEPKGGPVCGGCAVGRSSSLRLCAKSGLVLVRTRRRGSRAGRGPSEAIVNLMADAACTTTTGFWRVEFEVRCGISARVGVVVVMVVVALRV
ncbi:hypothetical protein C8Q78DRAFT_369648 [Trametes maxima]|nr:hypothetical protein C8Q78DRAFT_369648 [Trametes maxima]